MIRIGILGDIGSGKSYVAKSFGFPFFDADREVGEIYQNNKKIFNKLKKNLPKYIRSFPVDKREVTHAILGNNKNLNKIVKIVHSEVRKKLYAFLKKNKNKKLVILDIPLLLENKINNKNDVLIYVDSKKKGILKRLKKRKNFNQKLLNKFKSIQLSNKIKKKKSQFIIKNDFTEKSVRKGIKDILKEII